MTRKVIKLYQCSDEDETLRIREVKTGPLAQNDLNSNDSFIIDNGSHGIWVWVGKKASQKERTEAMRNAQGFIKKKGAAINNLSQSQSENARNNKSKFRNKSVFYPFPRSEPRLFCFSLFTSEFFEMFCNATRYPHGLKTKQSGECKLKTAIMHFSRLEHFNSKQKLIALNYVFSRLQRSNSSHSSY